MRDHIMRAEKVTESPPSPLQRLLCPSAPCAIDDGAGGGDPMTMVAGDWRLFARVRHVGDVGEVIEQFTLPSGEVVSARWNDDLGVVSVPFDLGEAYENYVSEAWKSRLPPRKLPPAALNVYYRSKRLIPRAAQLAARRMLIRWQGLPTFPRWPFDDSILRLLQFYARCLLLSARADELEFQWFWPTGFTAAAILTHDVESEEGLRLAVELADLEEERGLRSSFNVVGAWYPIDFGIVRELQSRGFEIGVHGIYHDHSLFASRAAFEAQQPALREALSALGAEGFRSPATHRVYDWIAELPISYDCSFPHSDPFEPQPGGCCSLWPFFIGPVVELPYTLPQDHTLFTLLGHRSPEIWVQQLDRIEQANGCAQALSHPDPGYLADPPKRRLYVEFLDVLAERTAIWKPLPRDLAAWWRDRDAGSSARWQLGAGTLRLRCGEVAFEPAPYTLASNQAE